MYLFHERENGVFRDATLFVYICLQNIATAYPAPSTNLVFDALVGVEHFIRSATGSCEGLQVAGA